MFWEDTYLVCCLPLFFCSAACMIASQRSTDRCLIDGAEPPLTHPIRSCGPLPRWFLQVEGFPLHSTAENPPHETKATHRPTDARSRHQQTVSLKWPSFESSQAGNARIGQTKYEARVFNSRPPPLPSLPAVRLSLACHRPPHLISLVVSCCSEQRAAPRCSVSATL